MEDLIKSFLSKNYDFGDGSGSGSGFGDDYGSGTGAGYGFVDGTGNGFGSEPKLSDGGGYGNGDGSGCGSGSGSGDGSGYSDGDGDGSGSGSGYGDICGCGNSDVTVGSGIKKYGEHSVYYVDGVPTLIYSVHGNYVKGAIINSDLTLSPCFIAKENNCFAHGETLQEAVEAAYNKTFQYLPEKKRIEKFLQKYHDKDKKHSGREFFNWHYILTGSCEMGRKQFCKDNNIDIDAEYTPMEFLNICKDAYGGEVMKQIIKIYETKNGESAFSGRCGSSSATIPEKVCSLFNILLKIFKNSKK